MICVCCLRDIAATCRITERTAQGIVTDLEAPGHLSRGRDGRRTRYTLHLGGTLPHAAETQLAFDAPGTRRLRGGE